MTAMRSLIADLAASAAEGLREILAHRGLCLRLARLEVLRRYRGTVLGLAWSFLTPLSLLLVYTFAFSVVIRIRWEGGSTGSHAEYALALFAGLLAFDLFSECVKAAPGLVPSHPGYVKRVVFPLSVLPLVNLLSALLHSLIGLLILALLSLFVLGRAPASILLAPLLYAPLVLLALGISYLLAAAGVFVRDLSPAVSLATQLLFFLTPVFYPVSAVPGGLRILLYLNPLTTIVEEFRNVLLWGKPLSLLPLLSVTILGALVLAAGLAFFTRTRRHFADLL